MIQFLKCCYYFCINIVANCKARLRIETWGTGLSVGKGTKILGGGIIRLGKECYIGPDSFIECRKGAKLTIGDSFSCTSNIFISSLGKISIGDDVLIGNNIRIYDSNHGMNPQKSYRDQPPEVEAVVIEDGVWIGDNVIILPGVTIGEKAVIGAGSVVSKSIPPYTIAAGVPANAKKKYDLSKEEWVLLK